MTQDKKDLLLKDLCARLPYGVKVQSYDLDDDMETIETLREIDSDGYVSTIECDTLKHTLKPYLFPLSSMTEEHKRELSNICKCLISFTDLEICFPNYEDNNMGNWQKIVSWMYKNHYDTNGLIPSRLAIDATGLNIY